MAWSNLAVEILGEFVAYGSGDSIEQQLRTAGGHSFGAGEADWKRFREWEKLAYQRGTERYLKRLEGKASWARARREEMAAACGFSSSPEARDRRNERERRKRAEVALTLGRAPGRLGEEERKERRQARVNANHEAWRARQTPETLRRERMTAAEREGRVVRRRSGGGQRNAADHGDRVDGAGQVGREAHAGEAAGGLVGQADGRERRHDDHAGAGHQ